MYATGLPPDLLPFRMPGLFPLHSGLLTPSLEVCAVSLPVEKLAENTGVPLSIARTMETLQSWHTYHQQEIPWSALLLKTFWPRGYTYISVYRGWIIAQQQAALVWPAEFLLCSFAWLAKGYVSWKDRPVEVKDCRGPLAWQWPSAANACRAAEKKNGPGLSKPFAFICPYPLILIWEAQFASISNSVILQASIESGLPNGQHSDHRNCLERFLSHAGQCLKY